MNSAPGTNETLAFARYYLELGLHPIPLAPRTKVPPKGFEPKKYHKLPPTKADIEKWFKDGRANIGLLMGRGMLAVDLDGDGAEERLADAGVELPADAPRSRTPTGGFHVLLSCEGPVPNSVKLLASQQLRPGTKKPVWQVDIRADGGYIAAPPSIHPDTGTAYEWERRISKDLPPAPEALLALIRQRATGKTKTAVPGASTQSPNWVTEALKGVGEGQRDDTCTRLAGYLLKKHPEDVAREILYTFADRCTPPFPRADVDKTVASVQRKDQAAKVAGEAATAGEFQILGYNQGSYFYLPRGARQVVELRAESHSKLNLLRLAPMQYWDAEYADRKGIAWDMAANALIQKCHAAGVYDTSRVRGRGAWWDGDQAVLHLGDVLIRGAEKIDVGSLAGGRYIYEAAPPIDLDLDAPLAKEEAVRLAELSAKISWKRPLSAQLFAGWCAIAPICGALTWRPHIWVTGGAGTGKSWLLEQIMRRLLGAIGLAVQSETTEAGLRQTLGHDARPVTFDEIEGEDERAQQRVQNVLALARQASSETGAVIIKGSPLGQAKTYRIRSCFAFSSIGVGVEKHADVTRVSVLELEPFQGTKEEREANYKRIQAEAGFLTDQYARSFLARSIRLAPVIRQNAATLASVGAVVIGTQRLGDQVGALLAGTYSLYQDDLLSPELAREWLEQLDWSEQRGIQEATDEQLCLNRILEATARVQTKNGPADRSIGELIRSSASISGDMLVLQSDAEAVLGRIGIRVDRLGGDRDFFTVSNTHNGIAEILRGTPWGRGWPRVLRRVERAKMTAGSVRFGATRSRGVEIPLEVLE